MNFPIRKQIAFCYHLLKFPFRYKGYPLGKRISIMLDYYKLYRKQRLQLSEYYEYEFEKCTKEFRETFLGWTEQGYYLKTLNPVKYYTLARNKYLAHLCLEKAGIPMPELLGYYNPYKTDAKNDFSALLIDLQEKNKTPFVIKATESSHGEGVYVVDSVSQKEEGTFLQLINGKTIALNEVLKHGDELIVESLIKQTKQFNSFNKTSVNTVRFMTTLYPDGEAKVIATWMKFGRLGTFVDNAGSGGNIDACVDVETGRINKVVEFKGFRKTKSITVHPDSGIQLEGTIIENWKEIKSKVIEFQKSFPFVKAAGWDIAITDDGPVVIEVNDSWDRTGQLFIQRGWKHEIRECFKEWDKIGYNPGVERFINGVNKSGLEELQSLYK